MTVERAGVCDPPGGDVVDKGMLHVVRDGECADHLAGVVDAVRKAVEPPSGVSSAIAHARMGRFAAMVRPPARDRS